MTRRGWVAFIFLVLLNLLPGALLPRIHPDNAPTVYLPLGTPGVVLEGRLRALFPVDEVLVFLLQGDGLFEDRVLLGLEEAGRKLEANPLVDRVLAVTRADHVRGSADGFAVEALLGPDVIGTLSPPERLQRATGDRFARDLLVASRGDALALVVRPKQLPGSLARVSLMEDARAIVAETGLAPLVVAVGGQLALDAAEFESMVRDSLVFVPATSLLGLLLVGWLYRRWAAVVLTALAIGAVIGPALAAIVLSGRPFTLVLAMMAPLLTAITVALLIHLFGSLQHVAARGATATDGVWRAVAVIRRPALMTAITTIGGLSSLGLSPILPVRDFGLASAVGVAFAVPVVLVLVPAVAEGLRNSIVGPLGRGGQAWVEAAIGWLASWGIRRAGWVVGAFFLVLAVSIPALWKVKVETDLYKFFAEDHELTQSTRRIESALTGVVTIEVLFEAESRDALKDPERLAAIAGFQKSLEQLPGVAKTVSMTDMVSEMHWAFNEEDPHYRRLPARSDLISQYLFVYDGTDLWELVDRDLRSTRLLVNLDQHGSSAVRKVIEQIERELTGTPPADLKWGIGGFGRLFTDNEELLIIGQMRSAAGAMVVIFAVFLLAWRSLRGSMLCMIPNVAPVVVIFCVMGLAGIWLDMATALIASVTIGVAVDDTIHLYHGYLQHRRRGASVVAALGRAYHRVGKAIVATTLIVGGQFLLLTLSNFIPTIEFGLLTAIGLMSALLFDLLLLPALIVLLSKRRRPVVEPS